MPQLIQARSEGDFIDGMSSQPRQSYVLLAAQKFLHVAHDPVDIMSRLGKEDFFRDQFAERITGKNLGTDNNSSPTCLWLEFQRHDGFAKRSALEDAPDAVEFRLQPLEGQFLPDDLESRDACSSDRRAPALGSCLEFILNRRQAKRTIETVSVAEHGPDKFTGKRQIVLASEVNYLLHKPLGLTGSMSALRPQPAGGPVRPPLCRLVERL